tara:strand:- start:1820 stop:2272 length:453 start_codon:yes stop_codon:yes gene_type:complete
MTKELTFRSITESDLNDVYEIENSVHYSPWQPSSFKPCFTGRNNGWLAFDGSKLCAYIILSMVADEAEILNMSVASDYQGKGVGSSLLEFSIQKAGVSCENLFLEVRESNDAAIALYEKYYFCEVGRRNNYYPAKRGREDALIYALTLNV